MISGEAIQSSPFHRGGANSPSAKIQHSRTKSATLIAVSTQVRSRVITNVACRSMRTLLVILGGGSKRIRAARVTSRSAVLLSHDTSVSGASSAHQIQREPSACSGHGGRAPSASSRARARRVAVRVQIVVQQLDRFPFPAGGQARVGECVSSAPPAAAGRPRRCRLPAPRGPAAGRRDRRRARRGSWDGSSARCPGSAAAAAKSTSWIKLVLEQVRPRAGAPPEQRCRGVRPVA